jgi:hypothetical protein
MSYCIQCGAQLADNQAFCTYCGAAQNVQQPQQPQYTQAPQYTQQPQYTQYPQYGQPINTQPELPMKWFKFVIYVQLFLSCFSNAVSALSAFTGSQYGTEAQAVYIVIPTLKIVDVIYAIALIGLAVFALIARSNLKNFRVNGPKFYHILLVAQVAVSVIYLVAANSVISNSIIGNSYSPDYTSVISSFITTGIMLLCNIKYFNKRKHLFVNP